MQNVETVQPMRSMRNKKIVKEAPSKKQLDMEYDKDHEAVRGIFRFHEVPGGTLNFVFKKWKGDDVLHYTMVDGQVYNIPLMVAKHLNKNCWYPVHDYELDDLGKFNNRYRIQKKVRRMSFQSLEFVDSDDITPVGAATIYTAESIGS